MAWKCWVTENTSTAYLSDNCIPRSGCFLLVFFIFLLLHQSTVIPQLKSFHTSMLQSCWTPMIISSCLTIWLKFKLSLSLRTGPWWFWSWQQNVARISIQISSKQELDKELWGCLLAMKRSWRQRGLSVLDFLSHLQGLVHHHLYCWTLDIITQMTCLQFKRKCLLTVSGFIAHMFGKTCQIF